MSLKIHSARDFFAAFWASSFLKAFLVFFWCFLKELWGGLIGGGVLDLVLVRVFYWFFKGFGGGGYGVVVFFLPFDDQVFFYLELLF